MCVNIRMYMCWCGTWLLIHDSIIQGNTPERCKPSNHFTLRGILRTHTRKLYYVVHNTCATYRVWYDTRL